MENNSAQQVLFVAGRRAIFGTFDWGIFDREALSGKDFSDVVVCISAGQGAGSRERIGVADIRVGVGRERAS